jgi:hypothetical protein
MKGETAMNNQRSLGTGLLFAAALAVPMSVSAAPMDVPSNVTVQFGQNQFPQDATALQPLHGSE